MAAKASKKPAKDKKSPGRPSKYSEALLAAICERLSAGDPLAQICREPDMPGVTTVWDWEQVHKGVSVAIARAREEGHHAIASRARLTARGKGEDAGGDSSGDVQRDKLIIDTDLKLLAKWSPRLYGDKIQLADAEGNNLPPPQFIVQPIASLPKDE